MASSSAPPRTSAASSPAKQCWIWPSCQEGRDDSFALENAWHGVPLPAVLEALGLRFVTRGSVRVPSATGWSTILDPDAARGAVLATGVAGAPLLVANGAPCRLVVPSRRGLDWVKWVSEVTIA